MGDEQHVALSIAYLVYIYLSIVQERSKLAATFGNRTRRIFSIYTRCLEVITCTTMYMVIETEYFIHFQVQNNVLIFNTIRNRPCRTFSCVSLVFSPLKTSALVCFAPLSWIHNLFGLFIIPTSNPSYGYSSSLRMLISVRYQQHEELCVLITSGNIRKF